MYDETKAIKKALTVGGIVFVAVIFLFGSFGIIDAGERGVKVRLGEVVGTVDTGPYFKLPILETVKKINVRTQVVKYENEAPLTGASKDLQDVSVSSVVTYHLEPTMVTDIYTQYKTLENFEDQVVRPAIRDIVKAQTSQYTAEELVTKRTVYSDSIVSKLNERLVALGVVIEQSNVTNLQFSQAFTQAIESKVTAVQNAEAQKNKLEQVKYEAQQQIEKAKAEAESIRIQASAVNSQGGADYVQLQAIAKWNGILPAQMIPGSTVPFVNLKN